MVRRRRAVHHLASANYRRAHSIRAALQVCDHLNSEVTLRSLILVLRVRQQEVTRYTSSACVLFRPGVTRARLNRKPGVRELKSLTCAAYHLSRDVMIHT